MYLDKTPNLPSGDFDRRMTWKKDQCTRKATLRMVVMKKLLASSWGADHRRSYTRDASDQCCNAECLPGGMLQIPTSRESPRCSESDLKNHD